MPAHEITAFLERTKKINSIGLFFLLFLFTGTYNLLISVCTYPPKMHSTAAAVQLAPNLSIQVATWETFADGGCPELSVCS